MRFRHADAITFAAGEVHLPCKCTEYTKRLATHVLDMDYSGELDFTLIGLSSTQRDYRLAWALNLQMGWCLERVEELVVATRKGTRSHARYRYDHLEEMLRIDLVANRSGVGAILPRNTRVDYLLKVSAPDGGQEPDWMKKLRNTPFVLAALKIEEELAANWHHLMD